MLPGESRQDFEAIRQMMVDDIRPETNIEWLWTLDLVELSWEILRYRRLKKRILDAHRVAAIEAILQRLDGEGMPSEEWSGHERGGCHARLPRKARGVRFPGPPDAVTPQNKTVQE